MCVILDPFEVPVMKVALDKGTLKDYILAANELTEDHVNISRKIRGFHILMCSINGQM